MRTRREKGPQPSPDKRLVDNGALAGNAQNAKKRMTGMAMRFFCRRYRRGIAPAVSR
jgi:hypothetical protein